MTGTERLSVIHYGDQAENPGIIWLTKLMYWRETSNGRDALSRKHRKHKDDFLAACLTAAESRDAAFFDNLSKACEAVTRGIADPDSELLLRITSIQDSESLRNSDVAEIAGRTIAGKAGRKMSPDTIARRAKALGIPLNTKPGNSKGAVIRRNSR